jgi:phage N-6-adenine-methyltransferase
MNTGVMFGKATDEWETPQAFFDALDTEFHFQIDCAARRDNAKCDLYFGPDVGAPYHDALTTDWTTGRPPFTCWLNPPYSQCRQFIAKAAEEAQKGCTVVCLVPARVDTRWFHDHVYDATTHRWRPGIEVRFIKGRLKFGNSNNSAPFPSVVIVFRPPGFTGTTHDTA